MRFLVWCLIVPLSSACSPPRMGAREKIPWIPTPTEDLGPIVAKVGDVPIFETEVRTRAIQTGKPPREALEDVVAFNLIAETARSSPLFSDSLALAPTKDILVQRLIEREFEPSSKPSDVPDQELRGLYERGRSYFVHPRLVEVAILCVYTGDRMKPEAKERSRKTALDLKAHIDTLGPGIAEDFLTLARDPTWSSRKVTVLRRWQSNDTPFSAKVGAEVLRLRKPGETTPLVADDTGFYIARYIAEQPPRNTSFKEARAEIATEYYARWREQRFIEFSRKIRAQHAVESFPDRIPSH